MENKLVLKRMEDPFKNKFGYPSRKVTFYDPSSKIEKSIFIHQRHAGDYGIWRKIEKDGYDSLFYGEIKNLTINESLIRSVRAFKDAQILDYKPNGIFIIFKYSKASKKRNLELALKNQLWQYIKTKGELFDPDELPEEI